MLYKSVLLAAFSLQPAQLREILKSLFVLLDVEWCQRPEGLQAGIVQHSLRFAQQKRRQNYRDWRARKSC
jgi:hypothetical protein